MKNQALVSPILRGVNEKNGVTTGRMMKDVLISLLVVYAFGFWKNGIMPFIDNPIYSNRVMVLLLPIINLIVACLVAVVCEAIFFKVTKKIENFKEGMLYAVTDSYALIPPIILLLIRPVNTPIFVTVFTVVLMTFVSKMLFGGFGRNIFNPAAIGAALYAAAFGGIVANEYGGWLSLNETDVASGSTPLENITGLDWVGVYDQVVTPFGTLWDFFLGFVPGAFGETSALLILTLGVILVLRKVIPWQTPVVYLVTIFFGAWLYAIIQGVPGPVLGVWYPIWYTLTGGIIFGAVFMFTEPVTSPVSNRGRIIFAFFGAVLTILFRQLAGTPGGVATAIVTMNLFTTLIDNKSSLIEAAKNKKPKIISACLVLVSGFAIFGLTIYKNPTTNESREDIYESAMANKGDVRLLEERQETLKHPDTNEYTSWRYLVSTEGYAGRITLSVTASQTTGNISVVRVVEHSETDNYGKLLLENKDYIENVKNAVNSGNFGGLDFNGTVNVGTDLKAGATETSSSLVDALLNVKLWSLDEEKLPEVYSCEEGYYCAAGYEGDIMIKVTFDSEALISSVEIEGFQNNEGLGQITKEEFETWLVGKSKTDIESLTANDINSGASVNITVNAIKEILLEAFEDHEGGIN